MKTRILLSILTALTASSAFATPALSSDNEDSWTKIPLQPNGFQGTIDAYALPNGTFRLAALPKALTAPARLTGDNLRHPERFAMFCRISEHSFVYMQKNVKRPYALDVSVNPLAASFATNDGTSVQIANPALNIFNPSAVVTLNSDSLAVTQGYLDAATVSADLTAQLGQQLDVVSRSGHASLDLTGMDSLACDLASGKASITVSISARFPAAKLYRDKVISADQFGGIYETINQSSSPGWSLPVLAGARLALAVEKQKSGWMNDLGWDTFLRLYSAIFDSSGAKQSVSANDYVAKSRSLDYLHPGNDTNTTVITQVPAIGPAQ